MNLMSVFWVLSIPLSIDLCPLFMQVDFEKNNYKKLEKELKKTSTALDEERAASAKHKQVIFLSFSIC